MPSCIERRVNTNYERIVSWTRYQVRTGGSRGADSIKRCHLTSIGNPLVEIRRSYHRLISTMGFPILVRRHHYIESGPRTWETPFATHCCGRRVNHSTMAHPSKTDGYQLNGISCRSGKTGSPLSCLHLAVAHIYNFCMEDSLEHVFVHWQHVKLQL